MAWEAALAILTAVLALATFGVVWVTYLMARQAKKQVEVSQATLAASQRPFLAPISKLSLTSDGDRKHYDFQQLDPGEQATLKNAGPGLALNISGVLVQPRPDAESEMNVVPRLRYLTYDTPMLSGDEVTPPMRGGGHIIGWDTYVGSDLENTLVAPKAPPMDEVFRDAVYRSVARLTVTFDDISGITYASQYDYTDLGMWRFHMSGQIEKGIEALARESRQKVIPTTR